MLSAYSVKKPYTVAVVVILVLMLGIISFMNMTTDLMPSIDLPYVVVMTTYPGATPEEVETAVTRPLEQSLATTTNIKTVSSVSSENTSLIILEFEQDANMDSIVIDMNGKIDMLKSNWPDGIGSPTIMKLNPDAMPIMLVSVDADGMDAKAITQLTDDVVVPALERLDGVASVSAQGLYEEQLKVSLDDAKIEALNEQITKKIDEGLDEAREKLDEAQQKLEDGKETLADESVSQMEKVEKAGMQMTDGKIQMSAAEIQLITGEAQLLQMRAQMQTSLDQLNAQLPELYKQREEIEKLLNGGGPPIDTQSAAALQASTPQATTPEEIISKLPPGWESYFPGGVEGLTPEQIVAMLPKEIIDAITGGGTDTPDTPDDPDTPDVPDIPNRKELEKALATLNENIAKLEKSKGELEQSIAATDARLAEISAGKAALEQSKAQLAAGENQLSSGKAQLQTGLTQASGELATADAVLKSKMDEFNAQSKAARGTSITAAITPSMVAQVLTAQNFAMPAGYVSLDDTQYVVKVGDKIDSMETLEEVPVFNTGIKDIDVVTLKDIANVEIINNAEEMYAVINGNNGIILSMQKQSTYSTADVSDRLNKAIEKLMADNPGMHISTLMDQGVYINIVVDNVLNNLLYGAILAVIVLLLFLRSIKPTIIIALSIPISVVFALVLMYFSGVTLNVISLAGLALGVGMLVDNSIVVIENIYRLRHEGASAKEAAIQGARQVTGAIIASTLTTVCVFLPIVFTQGISRQLFSDMGLTIAYSLFASLLVALTLIPAMSSRMIGKTREDKHQTFGKFLNGYGKVLGWTLRFKPVVLIAVFLLFAWCVYSVFSMGVTFMPKIDSTQLTVSLKMPREHNSFDETVAMSNDVLDKIMTVPDVETVGAMMGGGSMVGGAALGISGGADTGSVSMYVILKEDKTATSEQVADDIRGLTEGLDCEISVSSSTMDITALSGEGIQVEVRGRDLDVMQDIAREVAQKLEETEGTMDVSDGMEETLPEIRITVKKEEAMKNGLTVAQVYNAVRGLVAADTSATKIELDNAEYPVVVVDGTESNLKMTDIRQLVLPTDVNGKKGEVKLYRIAKIDEAESLASIRRENQVRYITVSAGVDSSHNVGLVTRDFQTKMDGMELPEGYTVDVKGENQTIMDALRDLIYMVLLAIALIYLIMVAQFQSLKSPFIVMFTIPLAFTGGLLALLIAGMDLSVISMLGFLILAGIVVNNGIVFVDYINQLRESGVPKREAIIEAGKTRLRPIMMTALTTILGLTTLALGVGQGADMLQPMAVVTIGGLSYATVLTLFVVPCLYDALHKKEKLPAAALEEGSEEQSKPIPRKLREDAQGEDGDK